MKVITLTAVFALFPMLLAQTLAAEKTYKMVGTEYPPFTFTDPATGTPAGFAVDLAKAMCTKSARTVSVELHPWKRAESMLAANPGTIAFMARTEAREHQYRWIGPVYRRRSYLWALASSNRAEQARKGELGTLTVSVVRGYASLDELRKTGIAERNISEATDDAQNLKKLLAGRVDLIPANDLVLAWKLRAEGIPPETLVALFDITSPDSNEYYFGIHRNADDTEVSLLQNALDNLRQSGEFDRLLAAYPIILRQGTQGAVK